MPYVLDFVYFLLILITSPYLLYRSWTTGRYREGWPEKLLGRAPRRVSRRPCVWFHAVSVGEVLLLRPVVAEMQRRRPGWDVVISTTTSTGLSIARRTFPELVTFYAPLDFSWATRRALARIRPTLLALVELELWPNLVRSARKSGATVAIVNGRLSARSLKGYRRIRHLLRSTLQGVDLVAAQSSEIAQRFEEIGIPRAHVRVTGSVKYDGLETNRGNAGSVQLRRDLGLNTAEVVFVAGSTMEGEEAAALEAYEAALARHQRLRLIVVPRHVERAPKIAQAILEAGHPLYLRSTSQVIYPEKRARSGAPVILVDTTGELPAVWGLADVAFVGGSLFPGRGGQNMMEPAAYGASVLFGPHTQNFREAVQGLLQCNGARRVSRVKDLTAALLEDLKDPEAAAARGEAARGYVLAQQGATARTLSLLDELVESPASRSSTLNSR